MRSDVNDRGSDNGMQVEMPMGVDVIERQPRRPVGFELRCDFFFDLPPQRRTKGDLHPIDGNIVAQPSAVADQARNIRAVECRLTVNQNDVQTDAKIGQGPRPLDRVGRGGTSDHQARGAENAAAMRFFDGGVNRLAQPEIIRGDNQAIQCANSRRSALQSNAL